MTNLTAAADAVLNAAFPVYNNDEVLYFVSGEQHTASIAAAALRAVADQLGYLLPFEDLSRIDVVDLLAIADELEGITYGTYRCDLETQ